MNVGIEQMRTNLMYSQKMKLILWLSIACLARIPPTDPNLCLALERLVRNTVGSSQAFHHQPYQVDVPQRVVLVVKYHMPLELLLSYLMLRGCRIGIEIGRFPGHTLFLRRMGMTVIGGLFRLHRGVKIEIVGMRCPGLHRRLAKR